jgi:hypothetical protein
MTFDLWAIAVALLAILGIIVATTPEGARRIERLARRLVELVSSLREARD